jgi:hypothetical protein
MNVCESDMTVYKPYQQMSRRTLQSASMHRSNRNAPQSVSSEVPSVPTDCSIPSTVALPSPPPSNIYLYQIVPGGPTGVKAGNEPQTVQAVPVALPGEGPRPPTHPAAPAGPPQPAPAKSNEKPRVIHEYYDQHGFVWREFNPEDTVVGDSSDPFIVYFRYVSKSIGARRTAYILPKHSKLIKIMQDCLPDFDWRAGEDLLVVTCHSWLILVESPNTVFATKSFRRCRGKVEAR